jgi:hypothetical protein
VKRALLVMLVILASVMYRVVDLTVVLGPPHLVTVSQGGGCYLSGPSGTLVKDPIFFTAMDILGPIAQPVAWPAGYSARVAGSEVEVLDTEGKVVATTGRRGYTLPFVDRGSVPPGFVGICAFSSNKP